MTTYDMHQHLWPPAFIDALRERTEAPALAEGVLTTPEGPFPVDLTLHDPVTRIGVLDRDGIDIAVLSLQPSLGLETLPTAERDRIEGIWIDGAAELVAAFPERFRALAPWRVVAGFAGTSVGASALVEEGRGEEVLERVDASSGLLFVHPEAEGLLPPGRPDWWHWTAGYTGQMQRAYLAWLGGARERYPSIRIVFAMLAGGAPIQHERLTHRGVHVRTAFDPNTLFDTSTYGRRAIELCIETFGVECLVYGSDTPVVDSAPTLRAVHGLGDSVARLLQSDTPGRLI